MKSVTLMSILSYNDNSFNHTLTLIQSASDSGRVSRMRRMLTPVSSNEQGPGPVGSASMEKDH